MTIKVTTLIKQEVEKEIELPFFFIAYPCDTAYKVVDERTVIAVDNISSYIGIHVQEFSGYLKELMEHERSRQISEEEFNQYYHKAFQHLEILWAEQKARLNESLPVTA